MTRGGRRGTERDLRFGPMRIPLVPRSSSLLWYALMAAAAVLLPPALAVTTAVWSVDELARNGSQTVLDAATTVDLARELAEHVTQMERLARQRHTLGDDARLGELYEVRRREFVDAAAALARMPLAPAVQGRLAALREEEDALHAVLIAAPLDKPGFDEALDRFAQLAAHARAIHSGSGDAIGLASHAMRGEAEALEQRLLVEAALVIPLVLGVLAVAALVIGRPLRALDDAIRTIGSGELGQPIAIGGPADLRDLGARLEWLRMRLIAVESDRVRLLRHVSHELKTPLTCVREGAQLLDDGVAGALNDGQREITGIIGANAAELGRRIEDLLRASQLQHAEVTLDLRLVDLEIVVRQVVDQNTMAARARDIRIDSVYEPIAVTGDAVKLRAVVDNLVSNGIKFSPPGGTLRVHLAAGPDTTATLTVEDEGPGFDPTEREAVFAAFYQGKASWMRQVGGTGLGLAIAREYARAHGGDVAIEDGAVGARVVLTLALSSGGPTLVGGRVGAAPPSAGAA